MLNQIVLVGRLTENLKIEKDGEKQKAIIRLAVQRPYKNEDGLYDTDFIDCELWNGVAENTSNYCHKGDIIGIKGRLQATKEDEKWAIKVVAEKVTFLSTKKDDE